MNNLLWKNISAYWNVIKDAHSIVRNLKNRDDDAKLFCNIVAARKNRLVLRILKLQGRMGLLCVDEFYFNPETIHFIDQGHQDFIRRYILEEEGIVRIETKSGECCEGRRFEQRSYLNGRLHDIDGEPAVQKSATHHIPDEGHLDEDVVECYSHGAFVSRQDRDVTARWSEQQRIAFGAV